MIWIIIALASYFLGSLAVILDKFLLGSKRIASPVIYSFYIALLGLAAIFFIPFGFYVPSIFQIIVSLISGSLFTFGILSLYFAIQRSEASRVTPVVGAVVPLASFIFHLIFLGEALTMAELLGCLLLVFGGLLISFDLPLRINKKKFFSGFYFSLLAGIILAGAYAGFKYVYNDQTFFNGFVWTRFGAFVSVLIYFLVPSWRKQIIESFKGFKKPKKHHFQTGYIFVGNKILGGLSSVLFNYAISLGSVTVINSIASVQYVFVLILAYFFARRMPKVFQEKLALNDWIQKLIAIIIIGLGIWLVGFQPVI